MYIGNYQIAQLIGTNHLGIMFKFIIQIFSMTPRFWACKTIFKSYMYIAIKPSAYRSSLNVHNSPNHSQNARTCTCMHAITEEPPYNEVLGTMKITLLSQVSHYFRVKTKKYKELGPAKLPCYKRVLSYPTSSQRGSTVL